MTGQPEKKFCSLGLHCLTSSFAVWAIRIMSEYVMSIGPLCVPRQITLTVSGLGEGG